MAPVPSAIDIKRSIEIAQFSSQAAEYLVQVFEAVLQKYPALKETSAALLQELRNMVVYASARSRQPGSEAWHAEDIPSRFDRLHQGIQNNALEIIDQLPKGVKVLLAYAFNKDTNQMMMGFAGSQQLPPAVVEALNTLLVSLLGKEDILVDDSSALVEGDNGKPVKDAQGHNKKADLKKAQEVIKRLFSSLLAEKGYPVEATQKTYPQAAKAEKAAAAETAAKKSVEAEKAAPEVKESSQAPQSGSGG